MYRIFANFSVKHIIRLKESDFVIATLLCGNNNEKNYLIKLKVNGKRETQSQTLGKYRSTI